MFLDAIGSTGIQVLNNEKVDVHGYKLFGVADWRGGRFRKLARHITIDAT